ncbi:hypothetical protein LXA47_20995 [Massilia sp. P8910]|uniref:hypothetical protein n=1 Tax=Massilia antarctica TaxID=2765360 RepID=UPI001E2ECCCF|nr:hypothetical protein [Massilia antarctica]MCE3606063.1 hypothetical protein [Massilia antarctica]
MSEHVLDALSEPLSQQAHLSRRQRHSPDDSLVLSELNPIAVVDLLDDDEVPVELITFGKVRETCPNCKHTHLKLVLRQRAVRVAHLFCAQCQACFDARYSNGAPALTI